MANYLCQKMYKTTSNTFCGIISYLMAKDIKSIMWIKGNFTYTLPNSHKC